MMISLRGINVTQLNCFKPFYRNPVKYFTRSSSTHQHNHNHEHHSHQHTHADTNNTQGDIPFSIPTPKTPPKSTGPQKLLNTYEYCVDLVKKFDKEHYTMGLLLPKHARRSFYVVRAFNVEITSVKEVVKDPKMGMIRMQWWKETITAAYQGNPPPQPVAKALFEVLQVQRLSKSWFLKLLDARTKEQHEHPFRTVDAMERFAEDTQSSLLYLTLECLGVINSTSADHVASHIGKALGLSILLRGTRFHAAQRNCYLPLDLLSKHGVTQESIYRGEPSEGLAETVFEIATKAKQHLHTARSLSQEAPKEAFPAYLSAAFADDYLNQLEKVNFNVFDLSVQPMSFWVQLKLLKNKLTNQF